MRGVTRETALQMIDRKGILIAIIAAAFGLTAVLTSDWQRLHIRFGAAESVTATAPLDEIALHFLSTYMNLLVLAITVMAAGLVPAMLDPNRASFYFSRPVSRERLAIDKMWGIVIIYSGLLLVTVAPVITAGMLRYDLIDARTGEIVLIQFFNCCIYLVLVSSFGLLWKSTWKSLAAVAILWSLQRILADPAPILDYLQLSFATPIFSTIYYALPKTVELGGAAHLIAAGKPVATFLPVVTTLLFAATVLYLAIVSIRRRDL